MYRSGHYMYRTAVIICTTSLTFSNCTFCPHSVFICFVWISEQTAIISLYSINWLVFITETECVYCAVRTECLHIIQVPLKSSGYHQFNINKFYVNVKLVVRILTNSAYHGRPLKRLLDTWDRNGSTSGPTPWQTYDDDDETTFSPHSVFMCFVWIWEQTAIISLYSINWLVFITETECVYCAVRTESLIQVSRGTNTST
jgi:hypothetical protein